MDNDFQCCLREAPPAGKLTQQVRISESPRFRRIPPVHVQRTILREQGNKCLYCSRRFGSQLWRGRKLIILKIQWDHRIPFAYAQNNGNENFAAACQICNRLKARFMFNSLEEARVYLYYKVIEKGYSTVSPVLGELHPQETMAKILHPEMPQGSMVLPSLPKNFVTMDMV